MNDASIDTGSTVRAAGSVTNIGKDPAVVRSAASKIQAAGHVADLVSKTRSQNADLRADCQLDAGYFVFLTVVRKCNEALAEYSLPTVREKSLKSLAC